MKMNIINVGYQKLTVDDSGPVQLTLPADPAIVHHALITVEADATSTDTSRAVRFRCDAIDPDASTGVPLGDLDVREISHTIDVENFSVIGIEGGKTHTLHIEYFGTDNI